MKLRAGVGCFSLGVLAAAAVRVVGGRGLEAAARAGGALLAARVERRDVEVRREQGGGLGGGSASAAPAILRHDAARRKQRRVWLEPVPALLVARACLGTLLLLCCLYRSAQVMFGPRPAGCKSALWFLRRLGGWSLRHRWRLRQRCKQRGGPRRHPLQRYRQRQLQRPLVLLQFLHLCSERSQLGQHILAVPARNQPILRLSQLFLEEARHCRGVHSGVKLWISCMR
eukprot:225987-Rhodomonas_salina.1